MQRKSFFYSSALFFLLSISACAAEKQDAEGSVVAPGTRLVAGDLAKNEFYILDQDERNPLFIAPKAQAQIAVNAKKTITSPQLMKVALHAVNNQPVHRRLGYQHKINTRVLAKRRLSPLNRSLQKPHQVNMALVSQYQMQTPHRVKIVWHDARQKPHRVNMALVKQFHPQKLHKINVALQKGRQRVQKVKV